MSVNVSGTTDCFGPIGCTGNDDIIVVPREVADGEAVLLAGLAANEPQQHQTTAQDRMQRREEYGTDYGIGSGEDSGETGWVVDHAPSFDLCLARHLSQPPMKKRSGRRA
jgi:hypothetical protein